MFLAFSSTSTAGQKLSTDENVNIRAAFIHVFGDLIQSIGVLLAAICIRWTGFAMADPLCTYLFSMIVFCTSIPVARDIFSTLMEGWLGWGI
jgi:solute carrier family 30 (zinc transporter), member 2